jgi:hypothetical protein
MAMRWFEALLDHGCSAFTAIFSDTRSLVESLSVNLQMLSVLLWGVLLYQRYYLHVPDEYKIYDNLYAKANLLMPAKHEGDDDSLPRYAIASRVRLCIASPSILRAVQSVARRTNDR